MNIQTYVMAHRGEPNYKLAQWLSKNQPDWERGSQCGMRVDVARNQTVRSFRLNDVPRGKTDLLLIDADMIPSMGTAKILTVEADFAYCGYVGHNGHSEGHQTTPGAGCLRVSETMLAMLAKPYFLVGTNDDADEIAGCECDYFAANARAAGFRPQRVGNIGHLGEKIVYPCEDGSRPFVEVWT